jgi:hypothetical protein
MELNYQDSKFVHETTLILWIVDDQKHEITTVNNTALVF